MIQKVIKTVQTFMNQNKGITLVIVLALIAAIFLNLPQSSSTTTAPKTLASVPETEQTESDDVEDDTGAHFPRYVGTDHDPFIPAVSQDNPQAGGPGSLMNGGKWTLTGIESIDGITSALVEDSVSNQSVFLQVGDKWGGLRVASISDDSIDFINPLGQVTQLGFPAPVAPPMTPGGAPSPAGSGYGFFGSNLPNVGQITPLPPLNPDAGSPATPNFGRFRGQQSN
jgi:hypothetical protein